jgi:hypothetical protein
MVHPFIDNRNILDKFQAHMKMGYSVHPLLGFHYNPMDIVAVAAGTEVDTEVDTAAAAAAAAAVAAFA